MFFRGKPNGSENALASLQLHVKIGILVLYATLYLHREKTSLIDFLYTIVFMYADISCGNNENSAKMSEWMLIARMGEEEYFSSQSSNILGECLIILQNGGNGPNFEKNATLNSIPEALQG